jgi:hypothetical protein
MRTLLQYKYILLAAAILTFGLYAQTSVITPVAIPETLVYVTPTFSSINVGRYSVPAVTDVNNDGLLDLFSGDLYGRIEYYVQADSGSANFILVDSLFCSIDVGGWAAPTFTDLDGDGLKDFLIGNLDGRIHHYEQMSSDGVHFELVTDFFNSIDVSFNAAPVVADIDRDGLLDLLIGDDFGYISHYVQNSPFSNEFTFVTDFFNFIDVGFNAHPALADIDSDGLTDLFIGNYEGHIRRYEQASANSTEFNLLDLKFHNIDPGYRSKPFFTDIDKDGLFDLLVGENDGNINRYEQNGLVSLDFGSLVLGEFSIKKYLVSVGGEADYLHIECMGNGFEISLTGNEYDFSSYQDIYPDSLGMCTDTVYVRFYPNYSGDFEGVLQHTSLMAPQVDIPLSGSSYLPVPVVSVNVEGPDVVLSWDEIAFELSYNVYSSEDPYGTFTLIATEIWDTWWSEPLTEAKKFYYVTANDFSQPPNRNKEEMK